MYDLGRLFDFARSFTVKMRKVGGKTYTFKQYKNGAIEVIQAGSTLLKPRRYYSATSKDALAVLLRTAPASGSVSGRVAAGTVRKSGPGIALQTGTDAAAQMAADVAPVQGGTDVAVQPMNPWWYAAGAAAGTGLLYLGYRALGRKKKE